MGVQSCSNGCPLVPVQSCSNGCPPVLHRFLSTGSCPPVLHRFIAACSPVSREPPACPETGSEPGCEPGCSRWMSPGIGLQSPSSGWFSTDPGKAGSGGCPAPARQAPMSRWAPTDSLPEAQNGDSGFEIPMGSGEDPSGCPVKPCQWVSSEPLSSEALPMGAQGRPVR
jgi:hypothetical protein